MDPSPIPWTVITSRRKRAKAPLEFNNVNSKDTAKKSRVGVSNAGASCNIIKEKEKKNKERKERNISNSSMVGPGSPGDSILADGTCRWCRTLKILVWRKCKVSTRPLPGVGCMPPPATPSPKSVPSRSVTRSSSPSVRSHRGRSLSTGRRPAVTPEPNLPQTTRRSMSNLPISSGKKS